MPDNPAAPLARSLVYRAQPVSPALVPLPVPETVALPALPPGQTFDMGCRPGRDDLDGQCPDDEALRAVPMPSPCAMGRFEVTQAQFSRFAREHNGHGLPAAAAEHFASGKLGNPQLPMTGVSWHDAQGYVQWLSAKTGQAWRLPTEAEWEYAARGGLSARYPWGNQAPPGRANCALCGDAVSGRRPAPVGRYAANRYGLHDMAGNVWEWVDDRYRTGDELRVLRGGSSYNAPDKLRVAGRYALYPDYRGPSIGFRVCLAPAQPTQAKFSTEAVAPAR